MLLALLLTNPDGSPMDIICGPSASQVLFAQTADAAVVGTVGLAAVVALALLTRPKGLPVRLPTDFDYFAAATAGLWIFAIFGPR